MFRVEKGQLIIDADIVGSIPAFQVMYNRDQSEGKRLALAKFQIIFHLKDPRSPYGLSSSHNRLTKIVMELFNCPDPVDPVQAKDVVEWFNHYYVPKKVNKKKEEENEKKNETVEEEAIVITDANFERAARQYFDFLELIPEQDMLSAAQDAVHRLADKIRDPNNKNAHNDLRSMNQAIEDIKQMRDLVKVEEERQRVTKGGHNVRKREDPDYILSKTPIRK